jgi:predicted GIY-YIG superfamily endonuclease
MSFWVYMLHCADKSYYTGHTDNLEKRLANIDQAKLKVILRRDFP